MRNSLVSSRCLKFDSGKWTMQPALGTKRRGCGCKYFSQVYILCNSLSFNGLQNLLFCVPKAAVLHGKSVGFATQKSRFRNAKSKLWFFLRIIFTESKLLWSSVLEILENSSSSRNSRYYRSFFAVRNVINIARACNCNYGNYGFAVSKMFSEAALSEKKENSLSF